MKPKEDVLNASRKKLKSPPKKKPSALASIYSATIEKKRLKSRGKLISRKGFQTQQESHSALRKLPRQT